MLERGGEFAMKQTGVVVECIGDKAKVKTHRHTMCHNCGKCDGGLHGIESPRDLEVIVENPVAAEEGQVVQLETAARGIFGAAFLVYILPLINFFLGFGFGQWLATYWGFAQQAELLGGAIAVLMLAATYCGLRIQEKKFARNKSFQAVITGILEE
jgi:sigma-E factor negative regulatory protein RseC